MDMESFAQVQVRFLFLLRSPEDSRVIIPLCRWCQTLHQTAFSTHIERPVQHSAVQKFLVLLRRSLTRGTILDQLWENEHMKNSTTVLLISTCAHSHTIYRHLLLVLMFCILFVFHFLSRSATASSQLILCHKDHTKNSQLCPFISNKKPNCSSIFTTFVFDNVTEWVCPC